MQIDTQGRIIGSFLIVSAYFIVLHVSATLGALMHLIANVISLPFFIRTKAHDVVIMLSFLMVISLTKLLWKFKDYPLLLVTNQLQNAQEQDIMAKILSVLNVNQSIKFITLVGLLVDV